MQTHQLVNGWWALPTTADQTTSPGLPTSTPSQTMVSLNLLPLSPHGSTACSSGRHRPTIHSEKLLLNLTTGDCLLTSNNTKRLTTISCQPMQKSTYMTASSRGSSITATSLKGGLKGLTWGKGSSDFNTLPYTQVGSPLGGPNLTSNSRGIKDKDVLSEKGGGVMGSLNEYWACQFYNSKLAHDGGPCDCLYAYSGMF